VDPVAWARTFDRYNRWMNGRIYPLCATLSDAERKRDRGAFFGSIHGTLNHLLLGDRLWLGRFLGRDYRITSLRAELYADFEELMREREHTDAEISQWVASLDAETLAAPFSYTTFIDPQTRTHALWIAVVHFFNHQTHHRGQLTTLMSQAGLDPGVTDLMWVPGLLPDSGS